MTHDSPRSPGSAADPGATEETPDELSAVRDLVDHATQRLLGDTIEVTDEQWAAPSALPGWTRGHVATHLARNADGFARLVAWAATGDRQDMYASPEARDAEIEQGAGRSGMELQIDLDSSADRLTAAFAALDAADRWADQVELRGGQQAPARLLPLMRLAEVALHHVDLDTGYTLDQLEPAAALWVLQLVAYRTASRPDYPALTLAPTDGDPVDLGPVDVSPAEDRTVVSGTATDLLGWVTRRGDASGLTGADGIDVPSYG